MTPENSCGNLSNLDIVRETPDREARPKRLPIRIL